HLPSRRSYFQHNHCGRSRSCSGIAFALTGSAFGRSAADSMSAFARGCHLLVSFIHFVCIAYPNMSEARGAASATTAAPARFVGSFLQLVDRPEVHAEAAHLVRPGVARPLANLGVAVEIPPGGQRGHAI